MKIKILLILLISFILQVKGQNKIIINGKVIDKETNESLEYATIVFKNSIGTSSDINGYFKLSLTDAKASDSLFISYMGYETIKIEVSKCMQINTYELKPNSIKLKEVEITSKKFELKPFIKKVITDYNKNKRGNSHIAIAHYREKAKENDRYIMFIESIGYSIYADNTENVSLLSNHKFFYENTRCYVSNPKWKKYKENKGGNDSQNVSPGGGANLNMFRYFESRGLLSNKYYKKYKFKKDSTYFIQNNLVYRIRFRGDIAKGSLHVYADSKEILKIEGSTTKYWSTAFHKRVDALISMQFNYFDSVPFISSIQVNYKHNKLEYQNNFKVLVQKFNDFKLTEEDYWSMNAYDTNPYIEYIPENWKTDEVDVDKDFNRIAADLNLKPIALEKQFVNFADRWFFTNEKTNELAKSKIKELKQNF